MFCPSCAHNNPDGSARCAACGTQLPPAPTGYAYPPGGAPGGMPGGMPYYAAPVERRTSGMAIAGFVLSFFCSILGLIFSIIGYNECKRSNGTVEGQGLALAGIIISIVSLVIGIIYFIAVAALVSRGPSY